MTLLPPKNSWYFEKNEINAVAKMLDSSASVTYKKCWIWKLGSLKNSATVLGSTLYIPLNWNSNQAYNVLPHEILGHVKQFKKYTWPGMIFLYGFFFLPIFFAWGRYRLELDANIEQWRYMLKNYTGGYAKNEVFLTDWILSNAQKTADRISSSFYLFAMPRYYTRSGFKKAALKLISEFIALDKE